jgi:hypothetical protein
MGAPFYSSNKTRWAAMETPKFPESWAIQRVSVSWKSYGIYSGMQRESSALKFLLWGTIINGTHTTTPCHDCVGFAAGRGLCITRERESFSRTMQPHTAHLGHGLFQSFHLELVDHFTLCSCHSCLIAEGRWFMQTRLRNSRHVWPGSLNKR